MFPGVVEVEEDDVNPLIGRPSEYEEYRLLLFERSEVGYRLGSHRVRVEVGEGDVNSLID